ncbi:hypothetical protein ANO11243_061420 [Dothideomycetidae sp. 11243]|nr:hypothetical protein ANO11243_061420 [fungal sp. No.11243]
MTTAASTTTSPVFYTVSTYNGEISGTQTVTFQQMLTSYGVTASVYAVAAAQYSSTMVASDAITACLDFVVYNEGNDEAYYQAELYYDTYSSFWECEQYHTDVPAASMYTTRVSTVGTVYAFSAIGGD